MIKTHWYNHAEKQVYQDVDIRQKDALLTEADNLLWVDIFDVVPEDLAVLTRAFGFHPLAIEDCLQQSPRAKVDRYDEYHFFVFHALRYNEESDKEIFTDELDVFLGENYIVTIHKNTLPSVAMVVKQVGGSSKLMQRGPDHLLYHIVDGILDEYFPILERIGERIDELEDEIYINPAKEITEEILALKRTILVLRKVIMPQKRIFGHVNGRYSFSVKEENKPYYMDLAENVYRIIDTTDTYRDLVNGAVDTYYSIISSKTNEVMRVLTIISVIMMPLTFITGFFGMNLPLPGAHNAFFVGYVFFGMILLTFGMLSFFKQKHWL